MLIERSALCSIFIVIPLPTFPKPTVVVVFTIVTSSAAAAFVIFAATTWVRASLGCGLRIATGFNILRLGGGLGGRRCRNTGAR